MAVGLGELGGRPIQEQRAKQHRCEGDLHTDDGEERDHSPWLPARGAGETAGAEVSGSARRGGRDEVGDDRG